MAIPMPTDTQALLGPEAARCESRSLFMDRFADPTAKDSTSQHPRRDWFNALLLKPVHGPAAQSRTEWLKRVAVQTEVVLLYAQLQSRLMVNMAGGVMENAGLCLDRYGLPYIPGSTVKGCARRMAIEQLRQAAHASETDPQLAAHLTDIARVFGWCDTDWEEGRKRGKNGKLGELKSDFEFACGEGESWKKVRPIAARALLDALRVTQRTHLDQPWLDLPNFAGSVCFLPAYPLEMKSARGLPLEMPREVGHLELDVVTCHHPDYYSQRKDNAGHLTMPVALDTEDPNPVVFPAVAPGHVFAFTVLPLRASTVGQTSGLPVWATSGGVSPVFGSRPGEPEARPTGRPEVCPTVLARRWLAAGLETFGLGAKTASGYGWFDAGEKVQSAVLAACQRAALQLNPVMMDEFLKWDDKRVRKAAAPFAFASLTPRTGREATEEYRFNLIKFILQHRAALFLAQKDHAGSDFAKGVKRLAEEFQQPLP